MPLPVYDAEHQLQMVREPGSPTLMHLRSDASAAQHAADASGLVLHALVVLPRSETRLAIGQGRSTLAACEPRHAFSADARGERGPSRKRLPAAASGPPGIKRRRPRGRAMAAMPSRGGGKRRGGTSDRMAPRRPNGGRWCFFSGRPSKLAPGWASAGSRPDPQSQDGQHAPSAHTQVRRQPSSQTHQPHQPHCARSACR
jgi:hypothetical protein